MRCRERCRYDPARRARIREPGKQSGGGLPRANGYSDRRCRPRTATAIHRSVAALLVGAVVSGGTAQVGAAEGGRAGFEEVTESVGLGYRTGAEPEEGVRHREPVDGGLSLSDIDSDGRLELYVAHGHGEIGRLFSWDGRRFVRLDGNLGIAPAAMDRAGYFLDFDHDGWPDFVSIHASGVQLFRNDGNRRFEEATGVFAIGSGGSTFSMAAGDYDADGDLDLFFAQWGKRWSGLRAVSHYLWRNDGKGRYEDVSHIVPIRPSASPYSTREQEFSLTPTFADIDNDGDLDILLTGDFGSSQILRNDAGIVFTDITGAAITDENGMGAAVGDFDRDGDMDWFVTSIHDADGSSGFGPTGNRLYRNLGDGRFEDVTGLAGVREGGWGWGTCIEDFDNDGHPDLFHTNGWFDDYAENEGVDREEERAEFLEDPSRLFMSNGDGSFSERASELGINHSGQGRGAVCTDYDGDGRVDILIANHGAAPTVYRNVFGNGNHWLAIDLVGQHANPHGIGALVTVRSEAGSQVQEVRLGGSYLSQAPPILHFGLGRDRIANSIEVRWPGPGNQVSRLANVAVDRRVTIRQPAPGGHLLSVVGGTGTGVHAGGTNVRIAAHSPRGHYRFSHWTSEGGGTLGDDRSPETTFRMPGNGVTVIAHFLPGPPARDVYVSVARRWMEVLLQAIRDDLARPTVHARNLFHVSAAMFDAWASYSGTATAYLFGDGGEGCRASAMPRGADARDAREEAISHTAWRLIRHRFLLSPGADATARNADTLMAALGYGTDLPASDAAALGRCIGEHYIARGLADGSNEEDGYGSTGYRPVNLYLDPSEAGNPELDDPDRWQPLWLRHYVDQSGHVGGSKPAFVTPEWGRVTPFALSGDDLAVRWREGPIFRGEEFLGDGTEYYVYHDPGRPPSLGGALSEHYKWGFALVARWSSQLSPDDGAMIDIAPSGMGNIAALPSPFEAYRGFYDSAAVHGPGYRTNPATGEPYERQVVPRGDYTRVLAEFWADGPDSETPPGHWFVILNAVNDHPLLVRRLGGEGPELSPLEWDVKSYFAMGGAMHDAAIAAWSIKGWYDYIRPISAIRFMADRGQSSNRALPSWSADGLPLVEGYIELVGPGDPLAGEEGEHVNKIKVRAWRGPEFIDDPDTDVAGVGWILAENWWPYQRPTFVTPPFAGYVSGHSTYSRAAAEVLTAFTGDAFFPGGMSEFRIPADEFLVFERGPSVGMTLQWATYRDAADQCSLSRIWGGIHPPADDIPGRFIGARVGLDAFRLARSYF